MNDLERVAKLLGWESRAVHVCLDEVGVGDARKAYTTRKMADAEFAITGCVVTHVKPPAYDTDANATAELRRYVRYRSRESDFARMVKLEIGAGDDFDLLDATPQQQLAAFCKVFAKELEAITNADQDFRSKSNSSM